MPILLTPGQRFDCRDCPARCCKTSWGIAVSDEEQERILADDAARERLGDDGVRILRRGVLPMRDTGDGLACLFLDDDQLCSLQKRHGHAFIPGNCQAYPFGFSQNEDGQPVALLSRYCPSIRDDYGDPVEERLAEKLEQVGGAHPMAEKMGLRSGRTMRKRHYARLVSAWAGRLQGDRPLGEVLLELFDLTDRVDEALPKKKDLQDAEVDTAIETAGLDLPVDEIRRRQSLAYDARVFFGFLLGGLSYPTRVLQPHRVGKVTFAERLRSWWNRAVWFLGMGRARLLFVERPVPVGRIGRVAPFLHGEAGAAVRDFLLEVLARRQGMGRQTYLHRVIVDLALMAVLISRYARAAAASEGLTEVRDDHVREGIGVAELLLTHGGNAQLMVLDQLRYKLMTGRDDLRRFIAHEV